MTYEPRQKRHVSMKRGAPETHSADMRTARTPSLVSGESNGDLDAMMQTKYQQHFLDNQIPTAEAEADRIAASVSGARTPEEVKTQLGEKMGADFSNVTFHTDSAARGMADTMGARAYTTGSDVYFGSGGFDPGVAAHELVHTVQQGMVGSTMQTTSAPTGGVQMMPKFLQKLRSYKTSKAGPKETAHNMEKATTILSGIVKQDPLELKKKHDEKRNDFLDSLEHPYNGLYESLDHTSFVGLQTLQQQYADFLSDLDAELSPVNLTGMDGTAALKNARGAKKISNDFQGLNLKGIYATDFSQDKSLKDAEAVAYSGSRVVKMNKPFFGKTRYLPSLRRTNGKYNGFTTGNTNYTLAHELGHIVNYQLADKFSEDGHQKLHGAPGAHDTWGKSEAITRMIIADVLAHQAGQDEQLQKLLSKRVKLDEGVSYTDAAGLNAIADALGSDKVKSKLLKDLYKGGYTSEYGSTQPMEMLAEAFGDHYRNEIKEDKYTKNAQNKKLTELRSNRNILSDLIVQRSRELFDDTDVDEINAGPKYIEGKKARGMERMETHGMIKRYELQKRFGFA